MLTLGIILLLAALACLVLLVVGVISPKLVKMSSRKKAAKTFFIATLLCLFGSFYASQLHDEKVAEDKRAALPVDDMMPVIEPPAGGYSKHDPNKRTPIVLRGAVTKMDKSEYPKLYKQLGEKEFNRANDNLEKAAQLMSENPKCDALEYVSISSSSKKGNINYFGDCSNGERVTVSEDSLKRGVAHAASNKVVNVSDKQAIDMCIYAIKQKLNVPSSFESSIFSRGVTKTKLGDLLVVVDFEAKNKLGVTSKLKGLCNIDENKNVSVSIIGDQS